MRYALNTRIMKMITKWDRVCVCVYALVCVWAREKRRERRNQNEIDARVKRAHSLLNWNDADCGDTKPLQKKRTTLSCYTCTLGLESTKWNRAEKAYTHDRRCERATWNNGIVYDIHTRRSHTHRDGEKKTTTISASSLEPQRKWKDAPMYNR